MRKLIIPLLVGALSVSFTLLPPANKAVVTTAATGTPSTPAPRPDEDASTLYNSLHLDQHGLSTEAFRYAWKGYQYLLSHKQIEREDYLTICDFSQSSSQKRLYIINVTTSELVLQTYVAHGKNSGGEFATHFSNQAESLESSLGFYITRSTYSGKHGLSLHIDGVDQGFNDKAMERTIVIHGAAYVDEARARQGIMMGRSWGCPAVSEKESGYIINTLKNGTCFFIYHPQKNYLQGSKILNG